MSVLQKQPLHPAGGSPQPPFPWEAPALRPWPCSSGRWWGDELSSRPSAGLWFRGGPKCFLTWGRNVSLLMELTAAGRVFRLVVEEHACNEWGNWINADNLMWKMHNQLAVEGWLVLFSVFLRHWDKHVYSLPSRWCVQQHETSRLVHMLPSQAHMCRLPNNWPSYANRLFASLELNKYMFNQSQHFTFSGVVLAEYSLQWFHWL